MSAQDIPLLIASENARSERRVSPAWSIAHLKDRLEPITGIPASAQRLTLKVASWPAQPLQAENEETTQLSSFPLQAYAEIQVSFESTVFVLLFPEFIAFITSVKRPQCRIKDTAEREVPCDLGEPLDAGVCYITAAAAPRSRRL